MMRAALAAMLLLAVAAAKADVVVVVSADSPVDSLTAAQVGDIFLGRTSSFPSGGEVLPIDQAEGSAAREAFYNAVIGRSQAQMRAYWSQQIFTGRGQPPRAVSNVAELRQVIGANPSVLSYVASSDVDDSLKVVYTP
ncbi:hypothetical protein CAI21_20920 [Alkalilimnicola ehrlichii]|uniref:Phosphate ABC transporter substrate-binding protein n=2 Tax=Alkalilimnicola ehrlichii TaxID=351052 RepID=A0A3E0WIE4_9GAMM|nr:hypothetical protein CAI21_20920 [Alkalilimnicola ehrlichii]RFA31736.1 hypothetical protein CAL65_21630 [Alkalilimnicola ehrlichii]